MSHNNQALADSEYSIWGEGLHEWLALLMATLIDLFP